MWRVQPIYDSWQVPNVLGINPKYSDNASVTAINDFGELIRSKILSAKKPPQSVVHLDSCFHHPYRNYFYEKPEWPEMSVRDAFVKWLSMHRLGEFNSTSSDALVYEQNKEFPCLKCCVNVRPEH